MSDTENSSNTEVQLQKDLEELAVFRKMVGSPQQLRHDVDALIKSYKDYINLLENQVVELQQVAEDTVKSKRRRRITIH